MTVPARRKHSSVPATRLGRLMRVGMMVGEMALGSAVHGARQLAAGKRPRAADVLLSVANAEVLAKRLSTLRGAAMKLGQMLSMAGDELLLPPAFRDALAILRSQGYAMPPAQLHRVIGREYGKGWQQRFTEFDDAPMAAASIGQVHRVRTRNGRDLVLKIQYPGIAKSVDSDVDNMTTLLRWLDILPGDLDLDALGAEAKRQLKIEADYEQEAAHARRFHRLLAGMDDYLVPRVHDDLSTRRILAMDFVEGEPLEALTQESVPQRLRNVVGRSLEGLMFHELFAFGCMQTDPNPANYLFQRDSGRLVLLDFGSTTDISASRMQGYREMCRSVIADDVEAIRRHALALGYTRADTGEEVIDDVVEIIRLVCEPLRHRGIYDFSKSQLPVRARDLGLEIAFRSGLPPPPSGTMFLHRKLVGTFMLCALLGARVDVQGLIMPHLEPA